MRRGSTVSEPPFAVNTVSLLETGASLHYGSWIFSLAVSRDEKLLACGGETGAPVTVWNLATGTVVARFHGLERQVQALAFSADGMQLAAANLWGGLRVWSLADGREIGRKPEENGRKARALTYCDTTPDALFPLVLADSVKGTQRRALAPGGREVAVQRATIEVRPYRRRVVVASWNPKEFAISKSGARSLAWSSDSKALALAGDGWVGAWLPFEPKPTFFAADTNSPECPSALAIVRGRGATWDVLYAQEREIVRVALPAVPERLRPTSWQEFLARVPEPTREPSAWPKTSWRWNESMSGHDGVEIRGGVVVWYNETLPSWAGGWVDEQTFESLLAEGARYSIPEPLLVELCQVVLRHVAAVAK